MALADLSDPNAVREAIAEFRRLGEAAFLLRYGFRPARAYFLNYRGERFPSKAIAGAAHGFQFPEQGPLRADEFSGGEATVQRKLEELGFDIEVMTSDDADRMRALAWFHDRAGELVDWPDA